MLKLPSILSMTVLEQFLRGLGLDPAAVMQEPPLTNLGVLAKDKAYLGAGVLFP
jgi:hypothetical protein